MAVTEQCIGCNMIVTDQDISCDLVVTNGAKNRHYHNNNRLVYSETAYEEVKKIP